MGLELLKKQRICQQAIFQQIFKNKCSLVGRFCVVYYQLNSLDYSRIGIIASKRSLRLAVQRNVFKRITRERFRLLQSSFSACDIIIIARKPAASANKQDIKICLDKLLGHLKQRSLT